MRCKVSKSSANIHTFKVKTPRSCLIILHFASPYFFFFAKLRTNCVGKIGFCRSPKHIVETHRVVFNLQSRGVYP